MIAPNNFARPYPVREVFFSLQGEGARSGSAAVFVRFADRGDQCEHLDAADLVARVKAADIVSVGCGWVVLKGGATAVAFDTPLRDALRHAGYRIAVEIDGGRALKASPDYVSVLPEPGAACSLQHASECRIVLDEGQYPDAAQAAMASRSTEVFVTPREIGAAAWVVGFVSTNSRYRVSFPLQRSIGIP